MCVCVCSSMSVGEYAFEHIRMPFTYVHKPTERLWQNPLLIVDCFNNNATYCGFLIRYSLTVITPKDFQWERYRLLYSSYV